MSRSSPTPFHAWLLVALVVGGIFFFIQGFTMKDESTEKKETTTERVSKEKEAPEKTSEKKPKKEDSKAEDAPPLKVSPPSIKVHGGPEGEKPPREVAEVAGRFHWLISLSAETGAKDQSVLAELKKVTTRSLYEEIKMRFELPKGKQTWKSIDVYPVSASSNTIQLNTVAVVNGEEQWYFEQLKWEGGKWRVEDFSIDLY